MQNRKHLAVLPDRGLALRGWLAAAGVLILLPAASAFAQTDTAFSGSLGSTGEKAAASAVASRTFGRGGRGTTVPMPPSGYYAGRTDFFPEGYGYYRPYTLAPRPVYRTEIGAQPIRTNTFSLGYVSFGGYGSYYY